MSLADIVNVTITAETRTPSRAGFGTPLFMGYHTNYLDLVRSYSDLAGLTTDGFLITDPAYLWAVKVFSQNPRPVSIKVGRRALAHTQTIELTPTDITEDLVYTVTIGAELVTYTVLSGDSVADLVTALFTAINLFTGAFTATDGVTEVSVVTDVAGVLFTYEGLNAGLDIEDVTAEPGIATDLAAVRLSDPDWYGLTLDSQSSAEVVSAAAWVETLPIIFGVASSDSNIPAVSAADIGSLLQASAYARTFVMYHQAPMSYPAGAWQGKQLPTDPGSSTWAYKTLAGIAVTTLDTNQITRLKTKNVNFYYLVGGLNITREGKMASGEFIDITRGIDWMEARIQEAVFSLLANNPKVPYTDLGTDMVRGAIDGVLNLGITRGILAATPIPTITIPEVANISTANRANRHLPDAAASLGLTSHNTFELTRVLDFRTNWRP